MKSTAKATWPSSVLALIAALERRRPRTGDEAAALVTDAGVRATDLTAWADFGHDPRDSYGRRLITADGGVELMVMSWLPGDTSAIHDHGRAAWGAVQVFGPAEHRVYRADAMSIREVSCERAAPGRVFVVGPALIHQMVSPQETAAPWLSLHLYGGDPEAGLAVTRDTRLYDPAEGVIRHTDGGAFIAPGADQFDGIERGPVGDPTLVARCRAETCARLARALEGRR